VKIETFAPMPSARMKTTVSVKPMFRRNSRRAKRTS